MKLFLIALLLVLLQSTPVRAQPDLIQEHAPYGVPACDTDNFKIRTAYLLCFNDVHRIPSWTMYHVKPDYRNTPERKSRFSSFRSDPDLANEASDDEYVGLFESHGYARGHFMPYGVLGGDRDRDGIYAHLEGESDPDDEQTVFEGNYMSNIAPQHHSGFNGSPGLWWHLERWVQDDMVQNRGEEAHIIAGAVMGQGEIEVVGQNSNISVPPMFYKIVSFDATNDKPQRVLAFLFPHQQVKHGRIQDFLTSVNIIENLTGLDFFQDIGIDEYEDSWRTWERWFADIDSTHTR